MLAALRNLLPAENLIYLGDTARLPYGTKSARSVTRYAEQATRHLTERAIKLLVVACNTASAVALAVLRSDYHPLPVVGVVEPGAAAACRTSTSGRIGVLATESTVDGGAYERAIRTLRPTADVKSRACPLLVSLAEEGWIEGDLVERIIARYLDPLLDTNLGASPDCLVLGCTHFPVLRRAIATVAGPAITLVDSAQTTAEVVRRQLDDTQLRRHADTPGKTQLLATDGRARFARVGGVFFGESIVDDQVELVDL